MRMMSVDCCASAEVVVAPLCTLCTTVAPAEPAAPAAPAAPAGRGVLGLGLGLGPGWHGLGLGLDLEDGVQSGHPVHVFVIPADYALMSCTGVTCVLAGWGELSARCTRPKLNSGVPRVALR